MAQQSEIQRGGYVIADVINVNPQTPGLDAMLAKFSREHIHTDDEVRFIVQGRGVFHIHPRSEEGDGAVVAIEVEAGDLIRVPQNTWHWFGLCADRQIRAIRLFQDWRVGGVDSNYQPLCLGPSYLPLQPAV